jgi:type II secretory pathway component PulK
MKYAFFILLGLLAPGLAAEPFPDRPGKKTVEKLCGSCHGLQIMAAMRKTKAAWRATVDEMVTKGMEASDADIEEAIAYLGRYLSRINVNKATAADLADVLSLPAAQAEAIVKQRANAEFRNFDDLVKTPGVDAQKLASQRDRIAFSGS